MKNKADGRIQSDLNVQKDVIETKRIHPPKPVHFLREIYWRGGFITFITLVSLEFDLEKETLHPENWKISKKSSLFPKSRFIIHAGENNFNGRAIAPLPVVILKKDCSKRHNFFSKVNKASINN